MQKEKKKAPAMDELPSTLLEQFSSTFMSIASFFHIHSSCIIFIKFNAKLTQ